jgi:flagellar motor switch protein FliM
MSAEAYDFRKPTRLAGGLEQRLGAWLEVACALAPAQWAKQLPVPLEMTFRKAETMRPADGLAQFPETAVGYTVNANAGESLALALLPRPCALALVNAALGATAEEAPENRELTSVEESVCEYLIQKLLMAPMQEAWPGADPLQLALGTREPAARWSRLFAPDDNVIACEFAVSGPFGEQPWYWLLPNKGLPRQLAERHRSETPAPQAAPDHRVEALVGGLPVEMVALLGTAELTLSQLAGLKAGDVVLLKQRVSEPLSAVVAGRPRFRVWPGRSGSRQACRIDSLTES